MTTLPLVALAAQPPSSITVVLDNNYPPYIFLDNHGNPQGILKDMWSLWSKKTGIHVNFKPMQWALALEAMKKGHADVIDTIFDTPKRKQFLSFSAPYADLDVNIFFQKKLSGITNAHSLHGFTVGVKEGDACIDYLAKHGIDSLKKYSSYNAEIEAAIHGNIKVMCIDKPPAIYLLNRLGDADDFQFSPPLYIGQFHWAVAKDQLGLKRIIEAGYSKITPKERNEIFKRWLGEEIPTSHWLMWVLYTVAVLLLIVFFLVLWNQMLQKRVAERTRKLSETLNSLKQSEEQARADHERMSLLLEYASDGIYGVDTNGICIFVNKACLHMHGYENEDDLVGTNIHDLIHHTYPDGRPYPKEHCNILVAVKEGKSVQVDDEVSWRRDGSFFPVEYKSHPMYLDNKLVGAVVSLTDITERKQIEKALQESEERYRKSFQTSPDAINITRLSDGKYLDVNRGFENLCGFSREEVVGKTSIELNIWHDPADRQRLIEKLKQDGVYENLEADFNTKNGGLFNGLMSAVVIKINEEDCIITITRDITQRKLAEAKIKRLSQLYAALSQCNQNIVRSTSESELLPLICQDAVDFGGMKMAWIGMLDKETNMVRPVASYGTGTEYLNGIEISLDSDSPTANGPTYRAIHGKQPYWTQDFQNDPVSAPWHERSQEFAWGASASLPLYRNGVVIGVFGLYSGEKNVFDESMQQLLIEMASDISFALDNFNKTIERDQALEKIRYQNTILNTQLETSLDAILVVDENGTITTYNKQFIDLWRIPEALVSARDDAPVLKFGLDQVEDKDAFSARVQYLYEHHEEKSREEILLKDGRIIDRYSAPVIGAHGKYYGRVWYFRDITDQKLAEQRISYLANFDGLTGLPNRFQLSDHLKYALSMAKRRDGHFAMMFIDIDHFKNINDTLGHSIGDSFLVLIAQRLQSVLREEDTAARLGGDEFILMLPDCDTQGAAQVAEKILRVISEPCHIEQFDLAVTASIGIALYPNDGMNMESLFKSADNAMYRAKQEGRNGYQFFTADMQASATRNMQLLNALRLALAHDQFQLHYQPQISINDGRVIGAEVLLRWTHPELGDISPIEFIPIAEESGLILSIGEWVLRTAVKQLKRWMDNGYPYMFIAVNLSVVQFRHSSLPNLITSIINEAGLPPKYLELELTEGVTLYDPLQAVEIMNNLHDRGIRMSIDDFGTGYSSLSYLKKFNAYKLKIDQSFVRDISTDLEDKAIVSAIISMSKSLGLKTIAEGVETAEQLAYLREQGCDEVQGYYFSKPLTADKMEAFLAGKKD